MSTATVSRPQFIDETTLAEITDLKVQTIRNWRCTKRVALPYLKIGRTVRYKLSDVEKFLASCEINPVDISRD